MLICQYSAHSMDGDPSFFVVVVVVVGGLCFLFGYKL